MNRTKRALPWLFSSAAAAFVTLPFALRPGVPGLHHDWVWPQHAAGLIHWFVVGASGWQPDGFGGALGSPTVNFVLAFLAGLAYAGIPTTAVLGVFLAACFVLAQMGMMRLFDVLEFGIEPLPAWLLAAAYAYGPVMFQKVVAGHLYFVCAYALLPWFVLCAWRACGKGPGRARNAVAAGLLLAVSSAQIQFLFFDAFVALVIALVRRGRLRNLLAFACICAIGLLHNVVLLLNAPGVEQSGLLLRHATLQWERDLSGTFGDLALLGGYMHYARSAVPSFLQQLFLLGRALLLVLGAGALAGAFITRRRRRITVVSAIVGLAALLAATGWNGPLQPVMQYALYHTALFTIFRELYHFMALYALGLVLLAACALAMLPSPVRVAGAVLAALVTLPFATMGLQRMIPAIPAQAFTPDCPAKNLFALLPAQQPIGLIDRPTESGIDPATFLPDDGAAGGEPVAVQWALATAASGNFAPLASLGFGCVRWRSNVASFLPASFEPHTGARFSVFLRRSASLRRATLQPRALSQARPLLSLEAEGYRDTLDDRLADAAVPPGQSIGLTSSFDNNDIRSTWVSGEMWAWMLPQVMNVASSPVLTQAPSIAYRAQVPQGAWSQLYVLAAARSVTLDGKAGSAVPASARGAYRWYRFPLQGQRAVQLQFVRATALARIIVSNDARWTSAAPRSATGTSVPLTALKQSMWSIAAVLPHFSGTRQVVFARRFSSGWHLFVGGKDEGAAHRAHGLFNAWSISGAGAGKTVVLKYVPQTFYWWVNGAATFLQILGLAFVLVRKPALRSEAMHAHRLAGKHV